MDTFIPAELITTAEQLGSSSAVARFDSQSIRSNFANDVNPDTFRHDWAPVIDGAPENLSEVLAEVAYSEEYDTFVSKLEIVRNDAARQCTEFATALSDLRETFNITGDDGIQWAKVTDSDWDSLIESGSYTGCLKKNAIFLVKVGGYGTLYTLYDDPADDVHDFVTCPDEVTMGNLVICDECFISPFSSGGIDTDDIRDFDDRTGL